MTKTRMDPSDVGREATITFIRTQMGRAAYRFRLLRLGATSVTFWVLVIAGGAWLESWGLRVVFLGFVATWLFIGFPILLMQAALILDVAFYALSRRSYFFVVIQGFAFLSSDEPRSRWPRIAAHAISYTSPLTPLAAWCYGVLIRLPDAQRAATVSFRPSPPPRAREKMQGEFMGNLGRENENELMHV